MRMFKPPDFHSRYRQPKNEKPIRWEERYPVSHMPPSALMLNSLKSGNQEEPEIPYPKDIVAFLDQFVIGQEMAKKTLAVGVHQHYKRVEFNETNREHAIIREIIEEELERKEKKEKVGVKKGNYCNLLLQTKKKSGFSLNVDPKDDLQMDKSNIVLLGPSGSGKTYLTKKLAAALNVPIALCDCTSLTQAGYVGEDVESVIQKLLVAADGDVEATQKGIVFLDEFDKIYTSSDPTHTGGNRDVNGRGVQQALLKLVEGSKCLVKNPLANNAKVDS